MIDLPLGDVYLEITNGFEIKPIRKTFTIERDTKQITLEVEKALHLREDGWSLQISTLLIPSVRTHRTRR